MAARRAFDRDLVPAQRGRASRSRGAEGNYSPLAAEALADRQAEYVEEVSREAARIARRNRSDLVSAADVEAADQELRQGRSSRANLPQLFGGVVFGVGLSEFIAVMSTTDLGHLALSCGVMAVGLWIVLRRSGRS